MRYPKKKYYEPEGLHERIYQCFIESGITLALMARRTGISRSTLNSYVNGDSIPNLHNLICMARVFHVSLDYLVLGREKEHALEICRDVIKVCEDEKREECEQCEYRAIVKEIRKIV